MSVRFRRWSRLGLTATVLGSTALGGAHAAPSTGIDPAADIPAETIELAGFWERGTSGEKGEKGGNGTSAASGKTGASGEGGEGEGAESTGVRTLPQHVAVMSARLKAGAALYRAGHPDLAAPQLLHPATDDYEAARAPLDGLGFKPAPFDAAAKAAGAGRPVGEVEAQLTAAEDNLAAVSKKAGGDAAGLVKFLMDHVIDQYVASIADGKVVDEGRYQMAWGSALAARDAAQGLDAQTRAAVGPEIEKLIALWPATPLPPETPASPGAVSAQASRVQLALPRS